MKKTKSSSKTVKEKPAASGSKRKSRKTKISTPEQVYLSLSARYQSIINPDAFILRLKEGNNH